MKHRQICIQIFLSLLWLWLFSNGASGITITIVNDCGFTVWPATYGGGGNELNSTGFELTKGNSRVFQTPANWNGRVWARTGCVFSESGHGSCEVGDCGSGELECKGSEGSFPITTARFDIREGMEVTYFVTIATTGYNIPMTVEATTGGTDLYDCLKTGCVNDLNKHCPRELWLVPGNACKTSCQVFGTDAYCCEPLIQPDICKPTPYTQLYHSLCPRLYYRRGFFDGTYSCDGANYTVRFCPPSDAFSNIKVGSKLKQNDQLLSIGGNFTLGFFGKEFDEMYVGIWYTSDAEVRKVWVANPNQPIKSNLTALSIDPNTGNLIITSGGTTVMKITDVQAGPNPNVTATLEDDGNFRLVNEIDKRVLWQSFDHPTNVLLPGMKLGYNTRTRQNWTLSSWLSDNIFDSGAFTLSWEPINETSQRLMIRRRGQPYWTSGFLDGNTFEFMDNPAGYENATKYNNLTSVYNNEERYFSYADDPSYVGNPAYLIEDTTDPFPMWILTPKGQITNHNISDALTPEWCYGYNASNGCMGSSYPMCRDGYFSYRQGMFSPQKTRNLTDSNLGLSISDCFVKCWNDCSCVGFNSSNTNGTGCVIWTGSDNSFVDGGNNSTMMYVISPQSPNYPSTSQDLGNKTGKDMKRLWALVVVPLFLGLGLLWYMKKRRQKRKEYKMRKRDEYFLELAASESFKDVHQLESDGHYGDLLLFSFASIMTATGDFSPENKLGQGGFGHVYKGRLNDGREIAIKRLSRSSGQGLVEFKNELILIAKLQHRNLVRILGCCIHGEEKMLIYEYMPNKSLDFFLFDENKRAELDWSKRFSIIEGIGQALLYLHKHSRMRVIHRDIKSNNILLDESMNPKISDFGMARIFNQNETQAMTNRVVGTYGYMSPEYAMEGTFSIKSDIFSFGVLILEILSGRRNSSFIHLDRTVNLLGYAWELWHQGNAMELEDPTLGSTCVVEQFLRTFHVALLCVQESATDRPTTSDMLSMLLNDNIPLPIPNRPAFFVGRVESNSTLDQIKPEDFSINDTTISAMQGR